MYAQKYHISHKRDDSWQMHQLHFHEGVELMLVLSEGGELFYDKEVYPLHAGTLLVLGCNKLHRTAGAPGIIFDRYVLRMLPMLVQELSTPCTDLWQVLQNSPPAVALEDEAKQQLLRLMEQLSTPADRERFGWDVQREITLLEILLLVCGVLQKAPVSVGTRAPDHDKVQPVLDYIQANYTHPLTLDDLARHFLVSKHYLCHLFKTGTGFSVMEYVIQLRVLEAQRLLRQGVSVQEAGERAGFQTYAHFIRTFSSITGVSPKQYAKQFRNGEFSVIRSQASGRQ